ncbi:hypothetical protein D3867_35895 (plasmid) [Azospirillum argentinense]|uniref:Uncharacterized protein n=1 Tax=Azospirillum brasilense TaxID=192 RepID=A0A4D8QGE3_AZOBR|nr:hypothetical protein D3867_35895 [Azospirillum argentinense]
MDRLLAWQIFALGTRATVAPWKGLSDGSGIRLSEGQLSILDGALDEIWADYLSGHPSHPVRIPSNWALVDGAAPNSTDREDWRRGNDAFLWHVAENVLFSLPLDLFMSDQDQRVAILRLVDDLVAWLIDYVNPPFKSQYWNAPQRPYEWCNKFMGFCAQLSGFLSTDEAWEHLVEPFTRFERDKGFAYISDFLQGLIERCLDPAQQVTPDFLALWSRLMDWVLNHPYCNPRWDYDHFGRDVEGCADALILCIFGRCWIGAPFMALPAFTPHVERWVKALGHNKRMFRSLCAFLSTAGWPLVAGVALGWLAAIADQHKSHGKFWGYLDNGEQLALLLDRLLDEHSAWLSKDPSQLAAAVAMADILVEHGVRVGARVQQRLAKLARS